MKNVKLLIVILVLLSAVSAHAKKVDVPDALLAGKNFWFQRAGIHASPDYASLRLSLSKTISDGSTPLIYIFNVNKEGFVIVSADDACTPILGYSFEGVYTGENLPDGFSYLLDLYTKDMIYILQQNLQADEYIRSSWKGLLVKDPSLMSGPLGPKSTTDVAPLLTCNWDQGFPYNAMCPVQNNTHAVVGCVATAMSMIMYYWRWPWQGTGSHCYTPPGFPQQCADFGNTTYDWNGMVDQPSGECDPVALLSWHTGIAVNMQYGIAGSSAYVNDVPNAMATYFKYSSICHFVNRSSYSNSRWHDSLHANLDKGEPVLYRGNDGSSGHAFVFDGYQANNYYHVNWGWSGSYNGYYQITNLNPGGYAFNSSQGAVFSLVPNPSQYPGYCSGNTDVKTYDMGSIEDGSGPWLDYQNDASCSWLIAPDDSISKVTLSFNRFDLATGDELKIYDGTSASAPLLGTYSGSDLPPAVSSTGPAMFVTFSANSSGTANGFLAQYSTSLNEFCSSSSVYLTDLNGSFNDGSGRFQYRNGANCKWRITPTGGIVSISVTFSTFNTEAGNDVVSMYDLQTGLPLGEFSGNPSPPPTVTASTNSILVIWNTNSSVRGEGWSATYSSVVGINENNIKNLAIYPNPANDILNVDFTLQAASDVKFELVNAQGVLNRSLQFESQSGNVHRTINVSDLSGGIYTLRIISSEGVVSRKIILRGF